MEIGKQKRTIIRNQQLTKRVSRKKMTWPEIAANTAEQCTTLDELRDAIRNFGGCELKNTAKKTVTHDGNHESGIVIVGEAPGANEDIQGIPFCGASGKLLDKMLAAVNLSRRSVYITNTVFWRPPGNRKPTNEEIEVCKPFFEKHIALLNPKVMFLLGATAAVAVLNTSISISKLRGKTYNYTNRYMENDRPPVVVVPSYHPAYLLRQPSCKKESWEDLKKLNSIVDSDLLSDC